MGCTRSSSSGASRSSRGTHKAFDTTEPPQMTDGNVSNTLNYKVICVNRNMSVLSGASLSLATSIPANPFYGTYVHMSSFVDRHICDASAQMCRSQPIYVIADKSKRHIFTF